MLIIISLTIILLDQLSKFYAVKYLPEYGPFEVLGNFLQFNFVKNYGAAFGILQHKQGFFIGITFLILFGIIYFIRTNNNTRLMNYGLTMVIGGAIGNLIDRMRMGYVIDFIDVKFGRFYDYPVFNIADSFIVIGTIIMVFLVLTNKYETE